MGEYVAASLLCERPAREQHPGQGVHVCVLWVPGRHCAQKCADGAVRVRIGHHGAHHGTPRGPGREHLPGPLGGDPPDADHRRVDGTGHPGEAGDTNGGSSVGLGAGGVHRPATDVVCAAGDRLPGDGGVVGGVADQETGRGQSAGRLQGEVVRSEVDAIGHSYGDLLVKRETPLLRAMEAFTFFRRSLDETAKQLAERDQMDAEQAALAREQIGGLADRVLLGVTAAYDDH